MNKKYISVLCIIALILQMITIAHGASDSAKDDEFNLAYKATSFASSVENSGTAYSIGTLNDGNNNTTFEPSWSNHYSQNPDRGEVYAGLEWSAKVRISRVKLYTVQGYELKNYDIQLWIDGKWVTAASVKENASAVCEHNFGEVYETNKIRVMCWSGPDIQPEVARITEIEAFCDGDIIESTAEKLASNYAEDISDDIVLPSKLLNGEIDVLWSSSDTSVIETSGLVRRPAPDSQDKKVELTAELTFGDYKLKKVIPVTVKKLNSDKDTVSLVKEALGLENQVNLIQDISLPTSDVRGYTNIEWESSDKSVITSEGKITRNPNGIKSAVLTAAITSGNVTEYKSFDITVMQAFTPKETVTSEKWRAAEIEFKSTAEYKYPYLDVDMEAIFTSQNGTVIKRKAFYDGDNIWRVRFAPTEEGEWTYITVSTNRLDTGLHGHSGKIICKPYSGEFDIYKRGFIRSEEGKRYLTYADGTPFFYTADCAWMGLSSRTPLYETNDPKNGESMFKTIIDTRVKQGYNGFRMNFFIGLGDDVYRDGNRNEGGYPWTQGRLCLDSASSSYGQSADMYAGPGRAMDGIKTNYWRAGSDAYPQWLQINFKEIKTVDKVNIIFNREDTWKFDIEISDDGTNYTKIYSTPQKGFKGKVFDYDLPKNADARFFRLYIIDSESKETAEVCEMTPYSDTGEILTNAHYFRDLNPDFFKNTDERIQYIVNNGLVADLGLDWGRQLMPGMIEDYNRFAEYINARYGAYPVMWYGAGEARTGNTESWIEVARHMKEIDSYNHVNTLHNDYDNVDYSTYCDDLSWQDMHYTQTGHTEPRFRDINYWLNIYNRKPVKPFIEGEADFENINGIESYLTREIYWKTVMAGSAGFVYSAEGLWQSTWDYDDLWQVWGSAPIPWYIALYKEAGRQLPYMKQFFEDIAWWELEPDDNAVVWNNAPNGSQRPYQKKNSDSSVVVAYIPSNTYAYNGVAKLRPNSKFTAKWYNTRNGEYLMIDNNIKTTQSGIWTIPNTPDCTTDWVLLVTLNAINIDAFNKLSFDCISTEQSYEVKNNVNLINTISGGAEIVWESSNNAVLNSKTGEVRQTDKDEQITLVAKITTDKGTDYKNFYLTVKAE